jgi:hypothetical protein
MLKFKDNDKYSISNNTYKIHPIFVYNIFLIFINKTNFSVHFVFNYFHYCYH